MNLFNAPLVENRALARSSFVLRLAGCEPLASARPGQFVMLRAAWGRDPLLPRAFSILRTLPDGGSEILVKAIGRGTRLLAELAVGAQLSVLGPLGQPFPAPEPGRTDLLVAGGVGLAPLLWHAELARAAGASCELFYGARTREELVLLDEIARSGCRLHLATEDGSLAGATHGRVTDALATRLTAGVPEGAVVLTCGPNPMMRAIALQARAYSLRTFVSVEGEMACGIGACLGCAVPYASVAEGCADGHLRGRAEPSQGSASMFGYACVDGPVFDASRIVIP